MQVTWLPDAESRPRHVAVGEFDGVHLGHRDVMRGADTVLTFEPHPRAVVAPETAPKLLTPLETKADLVAGLGVRELVVIPFDGAFASRTPQDFIDQVLVETLGAERVSVGENFRFGHRAKGDVALLRAQDSFETRVVDLVAVDGEIISSTSIRTLIEAGEMERAGACMGSPFQLRGLVAHGDKRGRTLGFPTANLVPDPALVYPGHGVYACRAAVELEGEWRWWPAATNVGVRPDVRDRPRAARGGVPAGLRRRPLRSRAAARVPRAPARRAALRVRRRADRADAARRRGHAQDRGLARRERAGVLLHCHVAHDDHR